MHPITKAHHLAPAQLPSVNEAQSFLRVARPPRRSGGSFAHTLCQQQKPVRRVVVVVGGGGGVLCAKGVRLFTFVAARIDEVAEAEAGAPCRIGGSVSVGERGAPTPPTPLPPQRRLTEFDKAVFRPKGRWDPRCSPPTHPGAPALHVRAHIRYVMKGTDGDG